MAATHTVAGDRVWDRLMAQQLKLLMVALLEPLEAPVHRPSRRCAGWPSSSSAPGPAPTGWRPSATRSRRSRPWMPVSCASAPRPAPCRRSPASGSRRAGSSPRPSPGSCRRTSPRCRRSRVGALVDGGESMYAALRGDCHLHSDWSDGGSPIDEMVLTGRRARPRVARAHRPQPRSYGSRTGSPPSGSPRRSASSMPSTARSGDRSGCSRASRSTSSTTVASTRPTRCWASSTSSRRRCTASCG